MVLGRGPEYGNRLDTTFAKALGKSYRGDRLVDRVERSREQTGLLTRYDGNGIFSPQPLDVLECFASGSECLILRLERVAEHVAVNLIRFENFSSPRPDIDVRRYR